MKSYRRGIVIVWVLLGLTAAASAADGDQAAEIRTEAFVQTPPSHWHDIDSDFMRAFHHPLEGVEMGLDLRLREVYAENIFSLNDDWSGDEDWNRNHWQRIRARWSIRWALSEDVDFDARLTWEFWNHCDPERNDVLGFFANQNLDFDEAIFDAFNFQWRNAFDAPLTLTIGRQDIILGTGWLVLDGTPGDGSRTIFFDAVRAEYQVSDTGKLNLIYIQQYDDESEWLPPFNHGAVDERRHLTQKQDERGVIVYYTDRLTDAINYDAYYIYKRERSSDWADFWPAQTPTSDGDINTFGGRLFGNLDEHWNYSAEAAYQFGRYRAPGGPSVDQRALGANTRLMYAFGDKLQNELHVGYEYLSGDDPSTSKNEKFNTLWGDWPQYQRGGDLQSYLWTFEGALGEVTNLHRVGVGHSFKPNEVWTIATDYNLFWADETGGADAFGATGANTLTNDNFRGHMISGIATYSCCQKFKTHFMLDYFIPGDYYAISDDAYFARINLEWTF